MWTIVFAISAAGAVGGLVNALLTDNGFALPRTEKVGDLSVYRPGMFGNVIVGIVAALISWGLYGPLATYNIIPDSKDLPNQPEPTLNLFALVGAVLVGVGGARWLTNEVDKSLLQGAAAKAASATPDKDKAVAMALASPAEAVALAESL